MSYSQALEKAWSDLAGVAVDKNLAVKFLSDAYSVDLDKKQVLSDSCNIPAKDYVSIITLHYLFLKMKSKELPNPTGGWIDFNQVEGGEIYFPTFKKRTIDQIVKKFGSNPELLLKSAERFPSKKGETGDVGIIVYPFEEIPIFITIWKGDDEFGPDANILYDKSIRNIFCTEDIVVLTEIVTHQL